MLLAKFGERTIIMYLIPSETSIQFSSGLESEEAIRSDRNLL